jgi:hypothetical protein
VAAPKLMLPVLLRPVTAASHPWTRRWLGTSRYWALQATGWGGFFLLSISSLLVMHGEQASADLEDSAAMVVFGVCTTHVVRVLILGFRRRSLPWWGLAGRLLVVVVLGGLALGGAMSWASVCIITRTTAEMDLIAQGEGLFAYLEIVTRSMFFVGVWVAIYFGCHYYLEHQDGTIERMQLRAAAQEAELTTLKAQLNPHFLFNSLNVIRAMIPRDLPAPREAVTSLSKLLRASLQHGTRELIPLSQELEMIEDYLRLEGIRHEKRLHVDWRVDEAALSCGIPPFAVQTLVENAINHGIGRRKAGGIVVVQAVVQGDALQVKITNPGRLSTGSTSTGLGLMNVRARLRLLWDGQARLDLEQAEEELVVATLIVPVVRGLPLA